MSSPKSDVAFRHASPAPGLVPGLNYPRCRRARCRAPQGLSRGQMRNWRRQRASARELGRIHELRLGFDILADVVPKNESDKLSKVQVLRYAMDYIQQLSEMNAMTAAPTTGAAATSTEWRQQQQPSGSESDQDAESRLMSMSASTSPASNISFSSFPSSGGSSSSRTDSPFSVQSLQDSFTAADPWSAAPARALDVSEYDLFSDTLQSSGWMPGSVEGGVSASIAPPMTERRCNTEALTTSSFSSLAQNNTLSADISNCSSQFPGQVSAMDRYCLETGFLESQTSAQLYNNSFSNMFGGPCGSGHLFPPYSTNLNTDTISCANDMQLNHFLPVMI